MRRVLANSIDSVEIAQVAHDVVAERWDNWDLTESLVYLVDSVNANVLPYLAEQFNVDGLAGFAVASNEREQRELIKISILLHKFMGTPWSIKKACETVGFTDIHLTEGVASNPPNPQIDWARFSVLIGFPDDRIINSANFLRLKNFINQYKPVRCHLADFGALLSFDEKESLFRPIFNNVGEHPIYDGTYDYSGEIYYGDLLRETLDIQIIGEPMTYFDVVIDDNEYFVVDDNSEVVISD